MQDEGPRQRVFRLEGQPAADGNRPGGRGRELGGAEVRRTGGRAKRGAGSRCGVDRCGPHCLANANRGPRVPQEKHVMQVTATFVPALRRATWLKGSGRPRHQKRENCHQEHQPSAQAPLPPGTPSLAPLAFPQTYHTGLMIRRFFHPANSIAPGAAGGKAQPMTLGWQPGLHLVGGEPTARASLTTWAQSKGTQVDHLPIGYRSPFGSERSARQVRLAPREVDRRRMIGYSSTHCWRE